MKQANLDKLAEEAVSHNPEILKKVMLRSGEIPHLTHFARARFPIGSIAAAHAHTDICEVFFVEAGEGTIYINGIAHILSPGTCIAVEPNEIHEVVNSGRVELVLTYFGLQV
ncbi:cupin domain-containing protein [Oscillatoria sp. FACHB-1406]|uniref:cupin domain-containing protein n=1 Tax=Oscillatoria sp. FACHB-1406 TaxID=2692846 RepID=UPI001688BD8F|nr:cupin domain-containing protein [Oscillatoria sp. FACHB-1406]MBD2576917.1 cupin domain-containing protein [Oscillatoria sp. FACHB-1406]